MTNPEVTILVPNYETVRLTQLCLRLLRKHTDPSVAQVIVIDNDSQDESLDYLRQLKWIHLIERAAISGESPALSHSRALDLGLSAVKTPYVLSIHTDTLMRNTDWLPFLLGEIKKSPHIAGVGSWKLEEKPFWKNQLKQIERVLQKTFYYCTGKKNHSLEGLDHNHYYLRSHCALYRTDLLHKHHLTFSQGSEVAGKVLHRQLILAGYEMIFLPSSILLKYMDHINHATTVLNPNLSRSQKSVTKGLSRVQKSLDAFNANDILNNKELDH